MACTNRALWRLLLVSMLASPRVASAEPISFLFNVHVDARSGTPTATPFEPVSFPLVATFEGIPSQIDRDPDTVFVVYGPARFSHIPLAAPGPHDGVPLEPELPSTATMSLRSAD